MGKFLMILSIAMLPFQGFTQQLSGSELLERAIQYHDPESNWNTFKGQFRVVMDSPNRPQRISDISLHLPKSYFKLLVEQGGTTTTYQLNKNDCHVLLNGSSNFTKEEANTHRLSCERGELMKDYYTYLYGLPMKLRDPGTQIDPQVRKKSFKGKEYLVLRVTYDKAVGEDTWYFYFDPKTYAMEVYQFFHDESKNDGEYILLEGQEQIQGIRMPKVRAWYYNKDNTYLGTDTLMPNTP